MKVFLLLIYIFAGDVKIEKTETKNLDACVEAGNKRVAELVTDPRLVRGLFADCIEVDARLI
jgi:hypothetical protein